jgi:hypothetical protein
VNALRPRADAEAVAQASEALAKADNAFTVNRQLSTFNRSLLEELTLNSHIQIRCYAQAEKLPVEYGE